MKDEKKSVSAGSVGVTGLLQVAFIVLKICGVIKWSWLWVLCPTWITAATVVLLLGISFIILLLTE